MSEKVCFLCQKTFKTNAALAAHRAKSHPRYRGKNRLAIEETIAELERQEHLDGKDAAKLQAVRSLADQLDSDPSNAQMWRTYHEALTDLVKTDDTGGDAFTQLLESINSRAPMGHTTAT